MTTKPWRSHVAIALLLFLVACGSSGEGDLAQTLKLNEDPSSVLLMLESGGGFVPIEFIVGQGPSLVLQRDGTVIGMGPQIEIFPGPLLANWQTTQLDAETMLFVFEELDAIGFPSIDRVDNTEISGVADAPTTTVTFYNQDGDHTFSVYALGMESQGVTDARVPILANLVQELYESAAVGSGRPYVAEAIQVVAGPAEGAFDPNDPTVTFLNWPLPESYAELTETGIDGWRCGSYEGESATSLLEVFERANQSTIFSEGDVNYRFQVRPLFAGEAPCEPVA